VGWRGGRGKKGLSSFTFPGIELAFGKALRPFGVSG